MSEKEGSRFTRPILLIALLLPLGLLTFIYLGTTQEFDRVPYEYDIIDGDTVYHTLPVFSLINTEGDTVTQADLKGKIVLLSFFAVGDDSLSKTTVLFGNLMRTYENIEWDMEPPFQFVSISTGDSLGVVRAFAQGQASDPAHWWFWTGEQAEVLKISGRALAFPELEKEEPGFDPFTSQRVALIDKEGRVRRYYVATDLQEERDIQEDLITLLRIDYPEDIEQMNAD